MCDGMTALVIGHAPAQIVGPVGLSVPNRIDEVLHGHSPLILARLLPGDAHPLLDVGAGAPTRGKGRFTQVCAGAVRSEMRAKDADQARHIRQSDLDVMVEPSCADQRRVQTRRIVAGGDQEHAFRLFEPIDHFQEGIHDRRPPCIMITTSASWNRVTLVKIDDAGFTPCGLEEGFADRSGDIAQVPGFV
jgi:hypothetical protein